MQHGFPISGAVIGALSSVLLAALAGPASATDGRALFVEHCAACHGVAAAGIRPTGSRVASDLGDAAAKGGADWILGVFSDSAGKLGQRHLRGFKGSDEELQAIADWLGGLE